MDRSEQVKELGALVEARKDLRNIGLAPANFGDAFSMAQALGKSSLVPKAMQNKPHDILLSLMWSRELRIGPAQGLTAIHIIEGRASLAAELMVALVLRSPECEYFQLTKSDAAVATYVTKRRNNPNSTEMSWTIEDAQRANLTGRTNWKSHPAAMLRARASAALARVVYPDIVLGVSLPDEIAEFTDGDEFSNPLNESQETVDLGQEIPQDAPESASEAAESDQAAEVDAILADIETAAQRADLTPISLRISDIKNETAQESLWQIYRAKRDSFENGQESQGDLLGGGRR
jgi:hypothetical protein